MKTRKKRILAMLLGFVMLLSCLSNSGFVAAKTHDANCRYHPGNPCTHTEHTDDCGYAEAYDGSPCSHTHDAICGYAQEQAAQPCTHVHDAGCGYQEGTPCTHVHENCSYREAQEERPCTCGSDTELHRLDCGYRPAAEEIPCDHVHSGDCGYSAPAACTHSHDPGCGYQAAAAASPCQHTHDASCGYEAPVQGSTCRHELGEHDETCGYQEAVPCTCETEEPKQNLYTVNAYYNGSNVLTWSASSTDTTLTISQQNNEVAQLFQQAVQTVEASGEQTFLGWALTSGATVPDYEERIPTIVLHYLRPSLELYAVTRENMPQETSFEIHPFIRYYDSEDFSQGGNVYDDLTPNSVTVSDAPVTLIAKYLGCPDQFTIEEKTYCLRGFTWAGTPSPQTDCTIPAFPQKEGPEKDDWMTTWSDGVTVVYVLQQEQEPEVHEHQFDLRITEERFLSSAATCASPALYYISCACGEPGTETFSFGDTEPNHTGNTYLMNARAATETIPGYTGDIYCSGCRTLLAYGSNIPATGKVPDDPVKKDGPDNGTDKKDPADTPHTAKDPNYNEASVGNVTITKDLTDAKLTINGTNMPANTSFQVTELKYGQWEQKTIVETLLNNIITQNPEYFGIPEGNAVQAAVYDPLLVDIKPDNLLPSNADSLITAEFPVGNLPEELAGSGAREVYFAVHVAENGTADLLFSQPGAVNQTPLNTEVPLFDVYTNSNSAILLPDSSGKKTTDEGKKDGDDEAEDPDQLKTVDDNEYQMKFVENNDTLKIVYAVGEEEPEEGEPEEEGNKEEEKSSGYRMKKDSYNYFKQYIAQNPSLEWLESEYDRQKRQISTDYVLSLDGYNKETRENAKGNHRYHTLELQEWETKYLKLLEQKRRLQKLIDETDANGGPIMDPIKRKVTYPIKGPSYSPFLFGRLILTVESDDAI